MNKKLNICFRGLIKIEKGDFISSIKLLPLKKCIMVFLTLINYNPIIVRPLASKCPHRVASSILHLPTITTEG